MLFMAMAGSTPLRMRGMDGPMAMAWKADFCDGCGKLRSERLSHPSSVDLMPGVPDSMKSCASKWERLGSGDPAACTIARLTLLPERLERRERRMQAEEAIEIDYGLARNVDAGPHRVILRLGVRHHDIQTVGGAALKDHDQPLGARARLSRAHSGASEKTRHRGRADDGKRAVAKKYATSDGHKKALLALGF